MASVGNDRINAPSQMRLHRLRRDPTLGEWLTVGRLEICQLISNGEPAKDTIMQQEQNKFTDSELVEAYSTYGQLGKIAAHFKVPHVQVWRAAKSLGLTFKVGGKQTSTPIEEILQGLHPHFQTLKVKGKLLRAGIFENKCSECGITEWLGKPINIQLDHINGDCSDHRLANLRMLCPNCHSQTDTWCGKNKGMTPDRKR